MGSFSPLGWLQRKVTPKYPYFILISFGWPLGFFDSLRLLSQYLVGWSCSHARYVVLDLADLHLGGNIQQSSELCFLLFSIQGTPLSICSIRLYNHTWCTSLVFKGFILIQFVSQCTPMPCVSIQRLELFLLMLWLALGVVVLLVDDQSCFCTLIAGC